MTKIELVEKMASDADITKAAAEKCLLITIGNKANLSVTSHG